MSNAASVGQISDSGSKRFSVLSHADAASVNTVGDGGSIISGSTADLVSIRSERSKMSYTGTIESSMSIVTMDKSPQGSEYTVNANRSFESNTSRRRNQDAPGAHTEDKEEGETVSITISEKKPKNPLYEMTNSELVEAVQNLQRNTRYLELENAVLLHFLQKNDPSLIEGMEEVLDYAQTKERMSVNRADRMSICSRRSRVSKYSRPSVAWSLTTSAETSSSNVPASAEKEGPRINVTQKTDLILREMEEIKTAMEIQSKHFYALRHKLKAELEEMSIREAEIRDTYNTFESVFITGTVEKYLQNKNPADKYCRFMEEWFKNSRLAVDKIRLRISSQRVQYQKICSQLIQKQLLGENLQEVDFEQLQIENKHLSVKIDQRNLLLLELKKMNGSANLLLSQNKRILLRKMNELQQIQDDITTKEEKIIKFDEECDKVNLELEDIKRGFDKIKINTEIYEIPDVMDYVRKKAELSILKKSLKVWARRKQIKDMALNASVREMKHATGISTPRAAWFMYNDSCDS